MSEKPAVEKVLRLNLVNDGRSVYLVTGDAVYRASPERGERVKIADIQLEQEPNYFYFLDADGDVARVKRQAPPHMGARVKVAKLGIVMEPMCVYTIEGADVVKRPIWPGAEKEIVRAAAFEPVPGEKYLLDEEGDIVRLVR